LYSYKWSWQHTFVFKSAAYVATWTSNEWYFLLNTLICVKREACITN
jgi:hypothetical protein